MRVVSCFAYEDSDKATHVVLEGYNLNLPQNEFASFPVTAAGPRQLNIPDAVIECEPYRRRSA